MVDQSDDGDLVGLLPLAGLPFVEQCDLAEEIHGAEHDVDAGRPDDEHAGLGGDERIFQGMRDPDGGVEADDPGRPFEGVGRPHQRLDRLGRLAGRFEGDQAFAQGSDLAVCLGPEEVHQRKPAQIVAHAPILRRAANTRGSSRTLTLRSPQPKTARL